ncbi:hypothetical protein [Leptospira levettii]|uniref:hypothetical protein n=1 Tax=Leptospira levettii TaxID=2023178 RepID=UPI000C2A1EB6|nr:hypothetical protein [Leptospira levettii]PJZ89538.1 hypothetical protein CH368_06155 [Leptospira levettii]
MPISEITLTTNSKVRLYHHEPNSVVNTLDILRLSGSFFEDSLFKVVTMLVRGQYGNFDDSIIPIGFKIQSYTTDEIVVGPGLLIAPDGVYRFEGATLVPNEAGHWGIFELEMVVELEESVGKKYLSPSGSATFLGAGPSRKSYRLRLYENYSTTPTFPVLTPGRVELIRFKKSGTGPSGVLVQSSNSLSKNAPKNAFSPGFIRQSLSPGDGEEWITVNGQDVPAKFTDLIDFLRDECRINDTELDFTISDGGGQTRVTFASPINAKNLHASPDLRYISVKITDTSVPGGLPVGFFKVVGITTNYFDLDIPYSVSMAGGTGKLNITPFAKSDLDGGGARLPFPSYLRNFLNGSTLDVNRLPLTYQDGQNKRHDHGSGNLGVAGQGLKPVSVSGGGSTSPAVTDVAISGSGNLGDHPGYGIITGGNPAPPITPKMTGDVGFSAMQSKGSLSVSFSGTGNVNVTGLDVDGATDEDGGEDPDNPNVTRVDDMAVYLLIKT